MPARLRARAFLGVFYGLAVAWLFLCLTFGHTLIVYGLAVLTSFFIGALGLRIFKSIEFRNYIEACNLRPKFTASIADDPRNWMQKGHREPYINNKG